MLCCCSSLPIENNKHPNFEWSRGWRDVVSFVLCSYPIWVQCLNNFVVDFSLRNVLSCCTSKQASLIRNLTVALSPVQQSPIGNKIWLYWTHPRNFGLSKSSVKIVCTYLMLAGVKCHTSFESKAICFENDIGHPCYSQLTAVKIGHLLTSVTWLYHRLRCITHWGDIF